MTATARRGSDKTAAADPTPLPAPKVTIENGVEPEAEASNGKTEGTGIVIQLPAGPKAPKHTRWVDIPQYEGFKMEIWVNYPQRLYDQMFGDNQKDADAASQRIFMQHNGWCDDEGVPYPPLSDPAFWNEIPTELAGVMIAVLRKETSELPNSLVRQRAR